jgi:hypothetical protein
VATWGSLGPLGGPPSPNGVLAGPIWDPVGRICDVAISLVSFAMDDFCYEHIHKYPQHHIRHVRGTTFDSTW